MFPKTPVAAASRKQASFRDENALLPGKSVLENGNAPKQPLKNKQFVTPTQQATRRVPLGGKDVNKHNSGRQQVSQPQQQQHNSGQQLANNPQHGHLKAPHSTGRSSMRASARKRLQVRNDNAAPLAETKHVGLPQHMWATTDIEIMPPKEEPAQDVFEEWTLEDDILGDTDVMAPVQGKRNSLDLEWDELDKLLPESPQTPKRGATSTPKRSVPVQGRSHVTQPFRTKSRDSTFTNASSSNAALPVKSKPIAKPFSRRPARAMVPSAQLRNKENTVKPPPASVTPARSATPSKIPVKKGPATTPGKPAVTPVRGTSTPVRSHNFMNPTKSAEAKMRTRVEVPSANINTPNNRASPKPRGGPSRMALSRMASRDTMSPTKEASATASGGSAATAGDSASDSDNRPTTADSNWSNVTDPMDRFSFEEDFDYLGN
ncbi:hypothetical protein CJU90_2566 [Yarrowia sp. C11]|nr:hypothetical protein CKK34_4014 [Yarrowia sp. E02]KAG5369122.1 hypothetical protein CJU90_2566 [Yarrowia sp. C11]